MRVLELNCTASLLKFYRKNKSCDIQTTYQYSMCTLTVILRRFEPKPYGNYRKIHQKYAG